MLHQSSPDIKDQELRMCPKCQKCKKKTKKPNKKQNEKTKKALRTTPDDNKNSF